MHLIVFMICCYIEIVDALVKDKKTFLHNNYHNDLMQDNLKETYFMLVIVINIILLAIFVLYPYM